MTCGRAGCGWLGAENSFPHAYSCPYSPSPPSWHGPAHALATTLPALPGASSMALAARRREKTGAPFPTTYNPLTNAMARRNSSAAPTRRGKYGRRTRVCLLRVWRGSAVRGGHGFPPLYACLICQTISAMPRGCFVGILPVPFGTLKTCSCSSDFLHPGTYCCGRFVTDGTLAHGLAAYGASKGFCAAAGISGSLFCRWTL
jgi:hypothetical protein